MIDCCGQRGISRKVIVAAEQLRSLPEGFRLIRQPVARYQNHGSRPRVRTPLEAGGNSGDSDVQELLGTEEQGGDVLTSGSQLQWATQAETPNVVRFFKLTCSAIPITAHGGRFAMPE